MKNKQFLQLLLGIIFFMLLYFIYDGNEETRSHTHQSSPIIIKTLPTEDLFKYKEISSLKAELALLKKKCGIRDIEKSSKIPVIYAITPTYARPVQKAELTRLSHTFMLVPNFHWIVVEDSGNKTKLVSELLETSGLPYTHLNIPTPANWKLKSKEPHWSKPRGVLQRNAALDWIRNNLDLSKDGVIYFADDDNSYSLQLFEEMRWTKGVGVWPVGLVGGVMVERPKVENGKVTGWLTVWNPRRPFAIDMAGFCINLNLFLSRPEGKFAFEVEKGYQESELLRHFVKSLSDVEPKADNCTKVYVWHTRTEPPNLKDEKLLQKAKKPPTDLGIEV